LGGGVFEGAAGVRGGALVLLILIGLAWWMTRPADRWLATIYPEAPSLLTHLHLEEYETLEECRSAARNYLAQQGLVDGLYECGLNCEPFGTDGAMRLCEETTE
jgi:hypothetical protein